MKGQTCIHGMPSPKSCVTCMEDYGVGPEPEAALPGFVHRFEALYAGLCPGCDKRIEPGDTIVKATDDSYWCDRCGRKLTRP